MSDHWDIYFCTVEDQFASIVLDMDVGHEMDPMEYSYPMGLRIHIKNPGESGTPVGEEADLVNELEDLLTNEVAMIGINVGRLTTNGVRELYYYFNSPYNLMDKASRIFNEQGYTVEVIEIVEEDPWEFYYNFLYPNKYQLQHMGNCKVVDSLAESGDVLEESRRVDHWLFFNSNLDRTNFEIKAKALGFNIVVDRLDDKDEYVSQIYREDYVNLHSINEVTDILVDLSEAYNGRYDGWETMVIK